MHYSFEIKIVMIAELEMRLDSQIFTHFALPNKKESIKQGCCPVLLFQKYTDEEAF